MAKNIWKVNSEINEHPNRNNFDLSYQNHLTMKMGTLYPIMCKEVVPGDSFKIDTAFGLKFMPLVFPVQSKMTAYVHYFYVRNKNLWKNWQNWLNGLETHTHPYINQPSSWFKTGSLSDYLDIPTTNISYDTVLTPVSDRRPYVDGGSYYYSGGSVVSAASGQVSDFSTELSYITPYRVNPTFSSYGLSPIGCPYPSDGVPQPSASVTAPSLYDSSYFVFYPTPFSLPSGLSTSSNNALEILLPYGSLTYTATIDGENVVNEFQLNGAGFAEGWNCYLFASLRGSDPRSSARVVNYSSGLDNFNSAGLMRIRFTSDTDAMKLSLQSLFGTDDLTDFDFYLSFAADGDSDYAISYSDGKDRHYLTSFNFPDVFFVNQSVTDLNDNPDVVKPFGSDANSNHQVKISALPFRAYESIYNAYYRNTQNQDFYINGVPQYNRYITTDEDGADTTDYHLFNRNWEQDFLTSCMPSPQQGVAPLVGMSALGSVTISDENGITTGQAVLADDGETITKIVLTSPAASVDHARTVLQIASSGMSINDFRNVNAFQRWLETNMRKGYKYRDFIAGHFGQSPEYKELDMPEFIGGTSQQVTVSQVTNMADTETLSGEGKKLGQFVGSANCFGGTQHSVSHYCDDYGFIVGIMCVVPTPSYSQLLPKMWLKNDKLDYYFPEFSQLGMQPITYREVAPIQSYHECIAVGSTKKMTDTFGYQRPNYDLVGYTDQVHGQFRSTLSSFLVSRLFAVRPELGSAFLTINPADTNHIFSYTSPAEDNIIGQVVCKVTAKRPVPRITIPSLGK